MRPQPELVSRRYANDGVPYGSLNAVQKRAIEQFLRDGRIRTNRTQNCNLCGNDSFTIVAEKDRFGIPLDTAVCRACGLIFSVERMTPDSTRLFYAEYYRQIYEGIETATTDHGPYLSRYEHASRSVSIPRYVRDDGVVVEIGCAGGWNLIPYRDRGHDYYGFDYDRELVSLGRDRFGLNLYEGGVDQAIEKGIRADYVMLYHVLEHAENPSAMLVRLGELLGAGGILKIIVPSANYLIYGGGGTGHDLLGTLQNAHNYLFDEFTLEHLSIKSGLEVKFLVGGNAVLRKPRYSRWPTANSPGLCHNGRGARVVRYLRNCERMVNVKDRIFGSRLLPLNTSSLLLRFFYLSRLRHVLKYWVIDRRGSGFLCE